MQMPQTLTLGLAQLWKLCLLVAIVASCILVALGMVFPEIAASCLLLLYGLDLICWADLRRQLVRRPAGSASNNGRYLVFLLLLATAPWELILPSASLIEGALPLLWGLRLFRVIQLNSLLYQQERISLQRPGLLKLMRLLINIIVVSHVLACGWLLLGYMAPELSWFSHSGIQALASASQYIRSLYWTITTMTTVGYGDITPVLDREYLFAGFVMLVGASFYAYIIGNVASLVGQLNANKAQYHQRAQFVSSYLYEQKVPAQLINRVQAYYLNRWEKYGNFNEEEILGDLPRSLALDIKTELARRLIEDVPLFKHASLVIREQLLAALQFEFVDPCSVIARVGERNQRIVFVIEGLLEIEYQNQIVGEFGPGDYFGNYSLILNEPRTASVIANSYSELMYLHRNDYEQIKQLYPEFVEVMKKAMASNSGKMSELVLQGVVL